MTPRALFDELLHLFNATLPEGARARYQACRGDLCFVEVSFANAESQAQFAEDLMSADGWDGPIVVQRREDETDPTTVFYLGQYGIDLQVDSSWGKAMARVALK